MPFAFPDSDDLAGALPPRIPCPRASSIVDAHRPGRECLVLSALESDLDQAEDLYDTIPYSTIY